jgi:hypothetical protein
MTGAATVNIFSCVGRSFTPERTFTAATPAPSGGLSVAVGDYNGDGWNDIILGSGAGARPAVMVYQGGPVLFNTTTTTPPPMLKEYFPTPATFTGGVKVTATPVNGGNPGTIERVFLEANLVGTTSFFFYSWLASDLLARH